MVRCWVSRFILLALLLPAPWAFAQGTEPNTAAADQASAERQELRRKFNELHWVKGPRQVKIADNSTLELPEGYLFLDKEDTAKFDELNHNIPNGEDVLVQPQTHEWAAYLRFSAEGLVKDDEKIDADAILSSMRRANEAANEERRRRGWDSMRIVGWAVPPAYNTTTKRLEWATTLESGGYQNVNFMTKILGRRGVTSVVLACDPNEREAAVAQLNTILGGYSFDSGERYADWVPGDKVATYGLTGLIVGGAAVAAAKSGLFKGLGVALAAAWKFVLVAIAGIGAWLKSLFSRKSSSS